MFLAVGLHQTRRMIGIAIHTAVTAAVIHANVHTGGTAAFRPLISVPDSPDRLSDDTFQPFSINAMSVGNLQGGKIQRFSTGLKF